MPFNTLISTAELTAHLADPAFTIVDCRFKLDNVDWGEAEWKRSHIPRAVYAHLDRDLSGKKSGTNGRHPLPDVQTFAATLGRMGIANDRQVVAYDQDNGMFASRLWWLLRWLGHDAVAVLDGGLARWIAEGRPVVTGTDESQPARFVPALRPSMIVGAADVESRRREAAWRVIDSRAPERYRGEIEPMDPVAGHIPGAANHFFQWNIDEQGRFRTPEDLRTRFTSIVGDVPAERVICYCGSGVQASQNLLALEHAGIVGAKLYPGSWSEWVSNPERPVATGAQ